MNRKKGSRDPWRKMAEQQRMGKRSTEHTRRLLLEKSGGKCHYCGSPLRLKDVTADHVHPKSKGGGNRLRNLVAACWDCNNAKGSQDAYAFKKQIHSVV